ncbi:hypothetical protein EC912_102551 [Luteibacter rhizovicinus]|uniref:Uncharacterized protein n=1 Tax=Luteibacter rhizovicinus TaxID=242606 RepID=A0A4R3YUD1_9GAMM|nr:hypothetical protein EC912_102551 [Luteibacter rhizovicinus]
MAGLSATLSVGARLRAKANRARKPDTHIRKLDLRAADATFILTAP